MNWKMANVFAGLLFWGWWADYLGMAVVLIILIALLIVQPSRREITDTQFNRIVDLTSLGLFSIGIYLVVTSGTQGLFILFAWLPKIMFPLYAVQLYSQQGGVKLSSLMWSLRGRQQALDLEYDRRVDLGWIYMAICVLSASANVVAHSWFFPSLLLIAALAMISMRSVRYHAGIWLVALMVGGLLGYAGQIGLRALHNQVEEVGITLLESWFSPDRDISHTRTAIGYIGNLKASNRIVWHVRAESGRPPGLLRQASYQSYRFGSWQSANNKLAPLQSPGDGIWIASESQGETQRLNLYGQLRGGVLPLPNGVSRIDNLPALSVGRSPLGSFVVDGGPEVANFNVEYSSMPEWGAMPGPEDLHIPQQLSATLEQITKELGIDASDSPESLRKIKNFFGNNFSYSLVLEGSEDDRLPLRTFLLEQRKGHCEYFATSGVMLLRAAGIPARYVGGYAVSEYSKLAGSWIVRKRHAHSWTQAYIDGQWRDLDFTPSTWADMEEQAAPWWIAITDLWSISLSRLNAWQGITAGGRNYFWWILTALVVLVVLWRNRARLLTQFSPARDTRASASYPGQDSPFYSIVKTFEEQGRGPVPSETMMQWLNRLTEEGMDKMKTNALKKALALHYQYRFDVNSESGLVKIALQHAVDEWKTVSGI